MALPYLFEFWAMAQAVQAVALIPGTGEYALATTPVYTQDASAGRQSANVSTPAGQTDFAHSLEVLGDELPACDAASLVVSWFGDDLRCGHCALRPKVTQKDAEGENMPWRVAGETRASAQAVRNEAGRAIYGGTPTDAAVIEAIQALNAAGKAVMFYPFILMEQARDNTLPDPYSDAASQPHLPWRGRITTSKAPGQPGSPDQTPAAAGEVAAFVGTVRASDFTIADGAVHYTGPQEWSLSRFILHYAALCQAAGGVDAFCISSKMRALTQVRSGPEDFPFVAQLRQLAAEVRALVGPETKVGYAADWTEYFGYQPQDGSNDVHFHLDPLWADAAIDFVGIDNYMPLSDWREGTSHADAEYGEIYNLAYLRANIEGGEGYDWYYHSDEARAAQIRTPITDGAYDAPWVYRYKDLRNWWARPHHARIGGVRQEAQTDWIPQSKPIWFTELGCAAVDKATNQPNKFLDAKSSESSLPRFSTGARDDLIQKRYLRAMLGYWNDPAHNPVSVEYAGPMLDMQRAFVWAWDTRPFPFFPNNTGLWSDGENYTRGHWINGRTGARTLANVVSEICDRAGLAAYDVSGMHGYVRGYSVAQVGTARAALQPLMLRYGFDAVERDGALRFVMRRAETAHLLDPERLALSPDLDATVEQTRAAEAEITGRVRVNSTEADGDFERIAEEAVLPDATTHAVAQSEVSMALTRAEGRQVAERWLTEAQVARDSVRLALPPSQMTIGAGDVVDLPQGVDTVPGRYRVDRVDSGMLQQIEAVRIEPSVYMPGPLDADLAGTKGFVPPVPVQSLFLDLPLLTGEEVPHAPYLAVTALPWPGSVALYSARTDADYALNMLVTARSVMGRTGSVLAKASPGIWDNGAALEVTLAQGALQSAPALSVLNGQNLCAIGDGSSDRWELFQFETAELIAPGTYLLSKRLRGQLGTDALMPEAWPAGSWCVLMDGTPDQIELAASLRRIAQYYRIGPAARVLDDPSFRQEVAAFDGNGLRPYAPVHLRASDAGAAVQFSWIRRTRIEGDSWDLRDVPLGEEVESYRVRILEGSNIQREAFVSSPAWVYEDTARSADGVAGAFDVEVAQMSARYGAGPAARLSLGAA